MAMGSSKGDRTRRAIKTLFFLITMLISLLLLSAPVVLAVTDALLPWAILSYSSSLSPPLFLSLQSLSSHFDNYHFFYSLVDIPLVSLVRSSVILVVYCFDDGPRLSKGPYLGIATACSVSSLAFVTLKIALYGFGGSGPGRGYGDRVVEVGLFLCSLLLAIGHVVVAHRTSCRERRKMMLVYKIDIEAVSLIRRRSEVKSSKHTIQ